MSVCGWQASLSDELRSQYKHYYRNTHPMSLTASLSTITETHSLGMKSEEPGLKTTFSFLVNTCVPSFKTRGNYRSSVVFIRQPRVLVQPKWDLIITGPSYYRGGKKKKKKRKRVMTSPPSSDKPAAICFRDYKKHSDYKIAFLSGGWWENFHTANIERDCRWE